jgi:hypothetical protein
VPFVTGSLPTSIAVIQPTWNECLYRPKLKRRGHGTSTSVTNPTSPSSQFDMYSASPGSCAVDSSELRLLDCLNIPQLPG